MLRCVALSVALGYYICFRTRVYCSNAVRTTRTMSMHRGTDIRAVARAIAGEYKIQISTTGRLLTPVLRESQPAFESSQNFSQED